MSRRLVLLAALALKAMRRATVRVRVVIATSTGSLAVTRTYRLCGGAGRR